MKIPDLKITYKHSVSPQDTCAAFLQQVSKQERHMEESWKEGQTLQFEQEIIVSNQILRKNTINS